MSKFTDEDDALLGELGVEVDAEQHASRSPKEERIIAGFENIQRFVDRHGRTPQHGEDRTRGGRRVTSQLVWKFETKNFKVVCEAVEPDFIDPLAHSEVVIDAINRGDALLMHLNARIYWRDQEVGHAHKIDCIHGSAPLPDGSEYRHAFDSMIVIDHGHRHKVARWAISKARQTLGELQGDLPDLYLQKIN